jgi:hypothetical protein
MCQKTKWVWRKTFEKGNCVQNLLELPSGKRLHNYGKIHHFSWENPIFLWPSSIAILTQSAGKNPNCEK